MAVFDTQAAWFVRIAGCYLALFFQFANTSMTLFVGA
jgi:hypothetical protein